MKLKLSLLFFAAVTTATAQTNTAVITSNGKTVGIVDNIYGAVVPVIKPDNTEGTAFFSDEWNKGSVVFKKGKRADSLMLKFDVVNNCLYFLQDSLILTFLDEVTFFRFVYRDSSEFKIATFKNGYPDQNSLTSETFYQVFNEGGSFHLLKHLKKTVTEEYTYNSPAKRKFTAQNDWYVYSAKNAEMIKIKPNKTSILKKLKSESFRIDDLCRKNNWELKTSDELIALFDELNKE